MTTRQLISNDGAIRRWRILDGDQEVGTDTETIPTPAQVNGATLRERIGVGLAESRVFLGRSTPTNPEILAQVRLLTRLTTAYGKLLLDQTDTTDGT